MHVHECACTCINVHVRAYYVHIHTHMYTNIHTYIHTSEDATVTHISGIPGDSLMTHIRTQMSTTSVNRQENNIRNETLNNRIANASMALVRLCLGNFLSVI